MAGLIGLNVYVADFYDERGEFAGSKTIHIGWRSVHKKTFQFKEGTYNVKLSGSHSHHCTFPYLIDYYHYSYRVGVPDPYKLDSEVSPMISSKDYNSILESDVLSKLNNVRSNLFANLFSLRNIIILLVIIGFAVYFFSGGELMGGSEVATQTVSQVSDVANTTLDHPFPPRPR